MARNIAFCAWCRGPSFWCKIRLILRGARARRVGKSRAVGESVRAKFGEFTFIVGGFWMLEFGGLVFGGLGDAQLWPSGRATPAAWSRLLTQLLIIDLRYR